MTAQITRFFSRAELGMRSPRSVSYDVHPENGGMAIHYGGNGPNPDPAEFERYRKIWLSWQNTHMDDKGWHDIAYSFGFNNLGQVFAGRGLGVRTAANGSNFGNESWLAAVWIGGGDYKPSTQALDAADWLIHHARTKGSAAFDVSPHHRFTATSCPGDILDDYAASRDGKAIILPGVMYMPYPGHQHANNLKDDWHVARIQKRLKALDLYTMSIDSKFGPGTEAAVKKFQKSKALLVDGYVGPKTWYALKIPV